jgi:AraC family transcriptional regulator
MLDYTSELTTLQFYPRLPRLSNYHSNYQLVQEGIYVSYHQQPAWEMPESCIPFHTIAINLSRKKLRSERSLGGQRQIDWRVSYSEVAVVPAHVSTQASWDQEAEFMMLILPPETIAQAAYETIDPDSVELLPHFDAPDPLIHQIGLSLKAELESPGQWSRLFIDAMKTALAVNLLRKYATHKGEIKEYQDGMPKYKLKQAIDYITAHLTGDLSLLDIATEVKMSPSYFATLFKCSTGLTVNQYITQRRISIAKRLLKQPGSKVIDVAQAVGFESHSYFAKVFRKQTGTTPIAYRNDRK